MFKSILTWIVRIGFGGELGEEKDSVYQKKKDSVYLCHLL